jgi:hypothetical protein
MSTLAIIAGTPPIRRPGFDLRIFSIRQSPACSPCAIVAGAPASASRLRRLASSAPHWLTTDMTTECDASARCFPRAALAEPITRAVPHGRSLHLTVSISRFDDAVDQGCNELHNSKDQMEFATHVREPGGLGNSELVAVRITALGARCRASLRLDRRRSMV